MNRAERRKYLLDAKFGKMFRDMATHCPICKGKTLHVAVLSEKHLCDIVCECCGTTVARNIEGCIPYTYVRWEEGAVDG